MTTLNVADLNAQERAVVEVLRLLGVKREPSLCAHVGMHLATLRRLCRSLEQRGWIERDTQAPIRWRLSYDAQAAPGRIE